MCYMAFSVLIHRRVGTATLAGEDKSMVTMQEKKWKGNSDELQMESSKMPSKWQNAQEMRAAT